MEIKLNIFNILGQKVKSVFNGVRKRGEYEYTWDGTNDYGDVLPSGIYLVRMTDNLRVQTKKVILVK